MHKYRRVKYSCDDCSTHRQAVQCHWVLSVEAILKAALAENPQLQGARLLLLLNSAEAGAVEVSTPEAALWKASRTPGTQLGRCSALHTRGAVWPLQLKSVSSRSAPWYTTVVGVAEVVVLMLYLSATDGQSNGA